jgi:hypothetical protein
MDPGLDNTTRRSETTVDSGYRSGVDLARDVQWGVEVEQFVPGGPEYQLIRRSAEGHGRQPGVLYRDDLGFMHWIADV